MDWLTSELVLEPACAEAICADCGTLIEEGSSQGLVDAEVVCVECAAMYRYVWPC